MQFAVGDKVVHPQYGPGQIVGVEQHELVEGFEHYYEIELLIHGSTLFLPVRKTDDLGVRPVMSQDKLARVLNILREVPQTLSRDFKVRQARIREKLATARPTKVAEAVRDLTGRKHRSHLTKVDRRLLDRGREFLAAEMAAANEIDALHAERTIDAALNGSDMRESETALRSSEVRESGASESVRVIDTNLTSKQQTLVRKLLKRARAGRP